MISQGAEIEAQADSGTPLQEAASLRMDEAVKILLDNNANVRKTLKHLSFMHTLPFPLASFSVPKFLLYPIFYACAAELDIPSFVFTVAVIPLCWFH